MSLLHDYWITTTSLDHIGAELTIEAITGLIIYPIGRRLLRRHDKTHHSAQPRKPTPRRQPTSPKLTPRDCRRFGVIAAMLFLVAVVAFSVGQQSTLPSNSTRPGVQASCHLVRTPGTADGADWYC